MKFLTLLIIFNILLIFLNKKSNSKKNRNSKKNQKPKNNCSITLVDNDFKSFQQNKIYYDNINIENLPSDLKNDVKEIILTNKLPSNYQNTCSYSILACENKNFKDCEFHSGVLKQGESKKIKTDKIHKMNSIKGTNMIEGIECNSKCDILLHGESNGKRRNEILHGCGEIAMIDNKQINNIDMISIKNNSDNPCNCKISVFNQFYFQGKSFTNSLYSSRGNNKMEIWNQKAGENWKKNIHSIKYVCSILEKDKMNILE